MNPRHDTAPDLTPLTTEAALDDRRAVRLAVAGIALVLLLLQVWRPYYFLNDDNMVGWLPIVVDMGRSLLAGQTPFISPHVFGGYPLLHDPSSLCLWNPLTVALSLLGDTPLRLAIVDLFVAANWLLGAWVFAHLLCRVRQKWAPWLDDGRIAFLTISYIASAYSIIVNASWLNFSSNVAALPLCLLGVWHPRRRSGVVLAACGFLHGLLVGHLSPWLWSMLFGTIFVIAFCRVERSWEGLKRWTGGLVLAMMVAAPVLWPALSGFLASSRGVSLSVQQASILDVPLPVLVLSFFGGVLGAAGGHFQIYMMASGLSYSIACCMASFWVFHSYGARQKPTAIEKCCLLCIALVTLFIVRPEWLSAAIAHVPLFRSLRHSFREVWLLLLWVHLWIALRPVKVSPRGARLSAVAAIAVLVVSLLPLGKPSFTVDTYNRHLLVSGEADAHWQKIRALLKPGQHILPAGTLTSRQLDEGKMPTVLIGAYNFAALFDVPSQSGYVILGLGADRDRSQRLPGPNGIWHLDAARRRLRSDPNLRLMVLHSDANGPLFISLDSLHSSKVLWRAPATPFRLGRPE